MIYAAASRALCALEVLANAYELAGDYVITPIELPDDTAIIALSISDLPSGWNSAQPITETIDIGTAWAQTMESVVLAVPSAVVPQDPNYLLNPKHPHFPKLRFLAPEPFLFDDRLRRAWVPATRP